MHIFELALLGLFILLLEIGMHNAKGAAWNRVNDKVNGYQRTEEFN
jgi:hypothetical protein